jgi:hypothetical protein
VSRPNACSSHGCKRQCGSVELYHFGWGRECQRQGIPVEEAQFVAAQSELSECIQRGYEAEKLKAGTSDYTMLDIAKAAGAFDDDMGQS